MYIKTSRIGPVPDWVDREAWESYKAEALGDSGRPYSRILGAIERYLSGPAARFLFNADGSIGWDEVEELAVKLADEVKKSYEPDFLAGVEKGGALYVRRLAEALDMDPNDPRRVSKIKITHYRHPLSRYLATQALFMPGAARIESEPSSLQIEGKKGLLADDDIATGKTLSCGKEYMKEKGAAEAKSATLYGNQSLLSKIGRGFSAENPDFFATEKGFATYPWYQLR